MLLAALPLACLYNFTIFLLCGHHGPAFDDRITYRLLHVYIFTCFTCMDHHQSMPMIRRANDHGLYVFIVEQLPVIAVGFYLCRIYI
jgi:hypothetical protein